MGKIDEYVSMLGRTATDKVTGFTGVVSTVSFDLYGCIQIVLVPKAKDDEVKTGSWFDVNRLSFLAVERVMPVPDFVSSPIADIKGPAPKPTR
jgi:hypothetical protein